MRLAVIEEALCPEILAVQFLEIATLLLLAELARPLYSDSTPLLRQGCLAGLPNPDI